MAIFTIEQLRDILRAFSQTQSDCFSENAIVALRKNGHKDRCKLKMINQEGTDIELCWTKEFSEAGYRENKKVTEKAAEAISFFLVNELTEYRIVEEAKMGSRIDYWLGYNEEHDSYDPLNIFRARLEVSGINKETPKNTVKARVGRKKKQIRKKGSSRLPAFISIVEFGTPKAVFETK